MVFKTLGTSEHHEILAKKYFSLWKLCTQRKKNDRFLSEKSKLYDTKISSFVLQMKTDTQKLSIEQSFITKDNKLQLRKGCAKSTTKCPYNEIFEHRFQAQKELIKNQKAVIDEQNEIILKLKTSIASSSNKNVLPFHENVNIAEVPSKQTKLLSKPPDHPLIIKMKEREEERKNRWLLHSLRKKEREIFIVQSKEFEEKEKKRLEIEKRKMRIYQQKEKEKLEKERELEMKREQNICRELHYYAKCRYNLILCFKVFQSWRAYIKKRFLILEKRCTYKYEMFLLKYHFKNWKKWAIQVTNSLKSAAVWMEKSCILAIVWFLWKAKVKKLRDQRTVLNKWLEQEIKSVMFKTWLKYSQQCLSEKQWLVKTTVFFYERALMLNTFYVWKKLPQVLYIEREREKRLREWESKVRSIIPDYNLQLM